MNDMSPQKFKESIETEPRMSFTEVILSWICLLAFAAVILILAIWPMVI